MSKPLVRPQVSRRTFFPIFFQHRHSRSDVKLFSPHFLRLEKKRFTHIMIRFRHIEHSSTFFHRSRFFSAPFHTQFLSVFSRLVNIPIGIEWREKRCEKQTQNSRTILYVTSEWDCDWIGWKIWRGCRAVHFFCSFDLSQSGGDCK